MTTGQIVAIVVLVLLVAIVVAAVMIFRRRSPSQRRLEAAQAHREAEARRASAERLEAEARERAERAKAEQAQAEELAAMARHDREVAREQQARAAQLDPDGEFALPPADEQRPAVAGPADRELPPATTDDAPRRSGQEYRRPEPIVAGAAEGMLKPRPAADDSAPTVPTPTPERATGPAAVPVQRSAADRSGERPGSVGEFVRAKDGPATGATDPAARHDRHDRHDRDNRDGINDRDRDADGVTDRSEGHHSPARTFADRILGRG